MKTMIRLSAALVLALGSIGNSVSVALAAPPINDTLANATSITLGPGEVTDDNVDTTEATTDANDTQVNATCGAPTIEASVWYALQASDETVRINATGSDYPTEIIVAVGTPGNLTTITCGPANIDFFATAGTTYYVLIADDQTDGGGNGGHLSVVFTSYAPAPTIDLTVNPHGTLHGKTGVATIYATYTCNNASYAGFGVDATETVGKSVITGQGDVPDAFGTCDGTPHDLLIDVYPQNGKFVGGKLEAVITYYACAGGQCDVTYLPVEIRMRSK